MKAESVGKPAESVDRLLVCGVLFLLADLFLVGRAWFLADMRLLAAMALPLSQCSLIAVWAAVSRANLSARFATPFVVLMGCWYLLTKIMPWGIGEPASAAWAMALAMQALVIVVVIQIHRRTSDAAGSRSADANHRRRPRLSFNLQTLMLWTTFVALGFGFIQFGRMHWLWDRSITQWDFLRAIPFIAVFNALVALLWLWAFADNRWQQRLGRGVLAIVAIACLGYLLPVLIDGATGTSAIGARELLLLAAAQSLLIVCSLAIVMR